MVKANINRSVLELVEGDITQQDTEAIVNAANSSLLGGGGVDGAIHRVAGPELLAECRTLGGCATGDAKITKGYRLKAKHVIHTVGPVYRGGPEDAGLLSSAYRRSLEVASENGLRSVAFPAISTGAYGYPLDEAARIALETAIAYLNEHTDIELVRFVLYGEHAYRAFEKALHDLLA
jgi:O-acetyl-ADP-ribose deacetylase (regulator of RNase III)